MQAQVLRAPVEIKSLADHPSGSDAGRRKRAGLILGLIRRARLASSPWPGPEIWTAETPSVAAISSFSPCQNEYP